MPAGRQLPAAVRRFYVAETKADAQYTSEIVIDELVAQGAAVGRTLPAGERRADPVVGARRRTRARWRFAVMSDAQFVARDPDSDIVAQARRTLREIKAAKPDFLVINGDLVDEASPGGLRARQADPRRGAGRRAALLLRARQPRGDGRPDRQLHGRIRGHLPDVRPQGHPLRHAGHLHG